MKVVSKFVALLVTVGLSLICVSASAAGYVKMDMAGFKGDASASAYKDQIEALTLQLGMTNGGTESTGKAISAAGKVHFGDLVFTKHADVASSGVMQAVASGQVIPKVTITVTKMDGAKEIVTTELTLSNVVVTGYTLSEGGATGKELGVTLSVETVTLAYAKIEWKFNPAPGKATTPSTSGSWDIGKNSKS